MRATICRSYTFEAAHHLPNLPDMHKCRRLHGHSYQVDVKISGDLDEDGMVLGVEFGALDLVMAPIIESVDHHMWNDKMTDPTVENIALWFLDLVGKTLGVPITIRVYEGPRSWAEVSS